MLALTFVTKKYIHTIVINHLLFVSANIIMKKNRALTTSLLTSNCIETLLPLTTVG